MKITNLSAQIRNSDRVNVSIDGVYRFSLDISQVADLGVRVGREITEDELAELEVESQYGKLYARVLEYCLMRPHSVSEVRAYLKRKTMPQKKLVPARPMRNKRPSGYSDVKGGERRVIEITGYSPTLAERVLSKLQQKEYVNDESFARWWVETRNQTKGTSLRKLRSELAAKGVGSDIIAAALHESARSDDEELQKIIAKKRNKYPDDQKLLQYLARQGFGYDDINRALEAARQPTDESGSL